MARLHKRFEFLRHTADLYIAAYGRNFRRGFENAAYVAFEDMTNLNKVRPKLEDTVEVEGLDKQALLCNWLEALLVKFDVTGDLYSRFRIDGIKQTSKGWRLKAKIWGEPFDAERRLSKVGVKAVAHHQMGIPQDARGAVTDKFILDI